VRGLWACLSALLIFACRDGRRYVPQIPEKQRGQRPHTYVDTLRKGESFYAGLKRRGVAPRHILELARSLKKVVDLRKVRPGGVYAFSCDSTGAIRWFSYQPDPETRIVVERQGERLAVRKERIPLERVERSLTGVVNTSLYEAMLAAGGTPRLVWEFADIFQWDIDFHTEPRQGDRFALVWEEYYKDGRPVRQGRILAAVYQSRTGEHWAVYFQDPSGREDYYTLEGKSLRKMFLKSPLRYRRISSNFSRRRFHPILRRYMPHWGVDYAAPPGTPVHATADGVVVFRGYKGPNGNMVILRHRNGYRTYYLHLSRFARGIRKGKKVKQGQVIGYVGATGLATGPHLDYRVRKGRRFVNPLKLRASNAQPVSRRYWEEFQRVRDRYVRILREALTRQMAA